MRNKIFIQIFWIFYYKNFGSGKIISQKIIEPKCNNIIELSFLNLQSNPFF